MSDLGKKETASKKRKKQDFSSHAMFFIGTCIFGVIIHACFMPMSSAMWKSFLISFGISCTYLIILFLSFAIPLKRGKLKESSWRYRWLEWFTAKRCGVETKSYDLFNMLMAATVVSAVFTVTDVISAVVVGIYFVLGNIILPFWNGKYVVLINGSPEYRKIPGMPSGLWMGILALVALCFLPQAVDYGKDIAFLATPILRSINPSPLVLFLVVIAVSIIALKLKS